MKFWIGVCGEKVQCLSKGFCFWTQNRLRKVVLYSVATPLWLPHAKGSLPQHFNRTTGLRRLSSLINDQNTPAYVNFAGFSVPNPAGLEMQLVLNSLYLDLFFSLRMNRDAAQCFGLLSNPQHATPNPLTQMSAQKTVAFTKTHKKREKSCGRRGNGLLRETEEAFVDVVSSATLRYLSHRRARYLVHHTWPSKSNNKSPIETDSPLFSLRRRTQSFLYYAATVQSWETQAVVFMHLCNAHTFPSFSLVIIQLQRSHLPPESSDPFQYCRAECLTVCWIFTWPLTESFSRRCWTPGLRCSCMSQHKLVKLQSQTLTRQGGESLPQGGSALTSDALSAGTVSGRLWRLGVWWHAAHPANVRFCM